jgi:hypothetical protein
MAWNQNIAGTMVTSLSFNPTKCRKSFSVESAKIDASFLITRELNYSKIESLLTETHVDS